ncbi:ABC transporter permease [Leucobacter sp. OH1287]|uniref:ABC transporter permease n=1 Tax=Leucobacter sp. OH1287 TaxID=2491049 RepID=UPI000F5E5A01|nr:ABC transporter permease [Leucobacter sp. OH1287]RRD59673.1 ABC transporter permease [Leucobacter sp. OH1287]
MFNVALAEFKMLLRNKLVAISSIVVPLTIAAVFIYSQDRFGGSSITAALITVMMVAMGVYVTATTTLAARRQSLFLKKMRTTTLSDNSIIAGLTLPIVLINVIQIAIVLVVLAVIGKMPENPHWVVIAVLSLELMYVALALVTSAFSNSPEHAQVTTLPILLLGMGVAFWVAVIDTEGNTLLNWALPGGAATDLLIKGWEFAEVDDVLRMVGFSLLWVIVSFWIAKRSFRWEPRK